MGKLNGILGRDTEYAAEIEVTTIRLDSFVYRDGNPLPQLIKMDIEGGGEKAIPGMECILSEAHPIIFAELHGPQEANVVWTALRKHGYRVQRMCPGYPELKDVRELDWKEYIIGMPS